jgi:hypothetical protein
MTYKKFCHELDIIDPDDPRAKALYDIYLEQLPVYTELEIQEMKGFDNDSCMLWLATMFCVGLAILTKIYHLW